jgi:PAS domain S-box-containing protein
MSPEVTAIPRDDLEAEVRRLRAEVAALRREPPARRVPPERVPDGPPQDAALEETLRHREGVVRRQLAEIEGIYAHAPIGLCVMDTALRWVRINHRLAEINGLPPEAHLGRTVRELLPTVADQAEDVLRRVMATGRPVLNVEITGETPAQPGVTRAWLESFFPLHDDRGELVGVSVACQEVTDQRRAERALRASEERFRLATEAMQGLVYDWDMVTGEIHRSAGLEELTGYKPDEVPTTAAWWQSQCDPADIAAATAAAAGVIAAREPRLHGRWLWLSDHCRFVYDDAGRPRRAIGCTVNIDASKRASAALRAGEERLRLTLEAGRLGAWNYDVAAGTVELDERVREIFGVADAPRPCPAGLLVDRVHPEDRDRVVASVNKALDPAGDGRYDAEYRVVRPDGAVRWARCAGRAHFVDADAAPRPVRLIGVMADVTEQRSATEALRRTETRLRAFFDSNVVGMIVGGPDGEVFECNDGYLRIIGYSREDHAAGRLRWDAITPPQWMPVDARHVEEARRFGRCTPYEKEYVRKDGTVVPVLVGFAMLDETPGHMVAFVLDLSDRKAADRAIAESELRLRLAVQNSGTVVSTFDRDLRYTWAYNPHPAFTVEQVLGRRDEEVMPPEDVAEFVRFKREVLESGAGGRRQISVRVGGQEHVYDVTAEPIRDQHGEVAGLITSGTDITEIVRARREAEEASRAKDHFLAVLSHELRTPLTPVNSALQLIEREPVNDRVREYVDVIRRNVDLETRLIDDLLDLNRISRGKLQLQSEAVDLHDVVRRVAAICESDLRGNRIDLRLDLRATRLRLRADPARLQQVLWNLLKNACKFTPAGGLIRVATADATDGGVSLTVADNGCGIPPERITRIFDAFEQGSPNVTRQFGGLGLGLAISRQLMVLHGGTLDAHSDGPDRGATFTLTLPAAAVAAAPAARPRAAASANRPAGARILLVEDNEDSARLLALLLGQLGHSVRTADSVAAALRTAAAQPFDLVVSDIGLPDGSGLDLMRELRARHRLAGVALSGYGMDEDLRRSHDAGFSDHLIKPVHIDRLQEAIGRLVSAKRG